MKRLSLSVMFLILCLVFVSAIPALAQQQSVMNVQFDKPVAIPGHVLPAGSYTFRLMDSTSYPSFVQILGANGLQEFGFIQVFPSRRRSYEGTKLVMSLPDQAGLERVVSWYFPGSRYGYQFIYSKRQLRNADLIAQRMQTKSNAGL